MSAILLLEGIEDDAAERYRVGGVYNLSPDERDELADEEGSLNDDPYEASVYDDEGYDDEY